jgi:hypothetical protein
MKYLCLIYQDETQMMKMSKGQGEAILSEYQALTEDIKRSGRYLGSNRLQPTGNASSVRVRDGKVSVTDGPFAETKEQLGGYFLIEAQDLNEAIQVAAKIPSARHGCVEVRPIWEL